jgi:hypothetical protein
MVEGLTYIKVCHMHCQQFLSLFSFLRCPSFVAPTAGWSSGSSSGS